MTEIQQFSLNESEEIGVLLDEAGIPYERQGAFASASRGRVEFVFLVPDDRLADTIQVIKSYYGFLDAPPEAVSGTCPACGATVNNVFECPDCGLTLSFDPRDSLKNHPFTVFLEELEKAGKLAG